MKIVLLEDEEALRKNMHKYLTLKGYEVEAYGDGDTLLDRSHWGDIGCLVLDINVPGSSGFEVLETLKSTDIAMPVIFISANKECSDIARAFDYGGCDYIKKPFELAELELRIRLRTREWKQEHDESAVIICDTYRYDTSKRQLFKSDEYIPLSPVISKLLSVFVQHGSALLSFDMLEELVWDGKAISRTTISSHIKELRRIIPCITIRNIRGEGYILARSQAFLTQS